MSPSLAERVTTQDRAEVLAEHIRRIVNAAPALTADQIERLRGLLPAPSTHHQ